LLSCEILRGRATGFEGFPACLRLMLCVPIVSSGGLLFELRVSGDSAFLVTEYLASENGGNFRRQLAKLCLDIEGAAEENPWRDAGGSPAAPQSGAPLGATSAAASDVSQRPASSGARPEAPLPADGSGGRDHSGSGPGPCPQEQQAPGGLADPPPDTSASASMRDRLQRAARLGQDAGRKLRGEIAAVPWEEPLAERSRFYVVLRGIGGVTGVWPRYGRGRSGQLGASSMVEDARGDMPGDVVHHGFPSSSEVVDYCKAAGVGVPERFA